MKTRIIFGALMIAVLSGVLWFDGYMESAKIWTKGSPFALDVIRGAGVAGILLVLAVLGVWECRKLCESAAMRIHTASAMISTCAIGLLPFWRQFLDNSSQSQLVLLVLGGIIWLVFLEQMVRGRVENAIKRISGTLFVIFYLGIGGAMILNIRLVEPHGLGKLILFLAAVKCTDIGAYFTGSFIGRHKMIRWLSPGKTWEGLAGGVITAAAVSIIIDSSGGLGLGIWFAGFFGAIVGVAGQFGDLCESLLKRDAAVKDSGSKLPEFGGILDIIDSPLIAAPLGYLLLVIQ